MEPRYRVQVAVPIPVIPGLSWKMNGKKEGSSPGYAGTHFDIQIKERLKPGPCVPQRGKPGMYEYGIDGCNQYILHRNLATDGTFSAAVSLWSKWTGLRLFGHSSASSGWLMMLIIL